MHKINLSPDIVSAMTAQRDGRSRAFGALDPARTAHVVIDLQNGFMEPGAPVEVAAALEIVPSVNAISRAVRETGGTNIFVQYTVNPEDLSGWSTWFNNFHGVKSGADMVGGFTRNARYWQLWPALEVRDADLRIEKTRFGAFIPGTCDLHRILQERSIDTLIITGTVTNCCCESTARDAMQLNYQVLFVADGNAAMSDEAHNGTLNSLYGLYADVVTTDEVIGLLRNAKLQSAAE